MIFRRFRLLLPALTVFLAGCENAAAPFMIDGSQHAISLIREQRYFWSSEVEQSLVVSRLPACQRRYPIAPGKTDSVDIEVFEAGYMLWAFRLKQRWYLAGTEKCLLQAWQDPPAEPPGREVGRFVRRDGALVFAPTGGVGGSVR